MCWPLVAYSGVGQEAWPQYPRPASGASEAEGKIQLSGAQRATAASRTFSELLFSSSDLFYSSSGLLPGPLSLLYSLLDTLCLPTDLFYSSSDLVMADSPSSSISLSKRVQQVVLVLLLLWSVVSLVVIVVWSTSPDLKGVAHCRAQLAQRMEQQEATQERWSKDKEALEEKVLEQQQEMLRWEREMQLLLVHFNQTKEELQDCQREQVSEEQ